MGSGQLCFRLGRKGNKPCHRTAHNKFPHSSSNQHVTLSRLNWATPRATGFAMESHNSKESGIECQVASTSKAVCWVGLWFGWRGISGCPVVISKRPYWRSSESESPAPQLHLMDAAPLLPYCWLKWAALGTGGLGQTQGSSQRRCKVDRLTSTEIDARLECTAPKEQRHLRIVVPGAAMSSFYGPRNGHSVGIQDQEDVSRPLRVETVRRCAGDRRRGQTASQKLRSRKGCHHSGNGSSTVAATSSACEG